MSRSLILTGESVYSNQKIRFGIRFSGADSDAFKTAMCHIPAEFLDKDFTVRFTDSNRNLRNIEWLFNGEVI